MTYEFAYLCHFFFCKYLFDFLEVIYFLSSFLSFLLGTQVPPWPQFDQLINNATAFGGNWFYPRPGFGGSGYGGPGFGNPGFWNQSFICNGK